jgi:hypothetical protein
MFKVYSDLPALVVTLLVLVLDLVTAIRILHGNSTLRARV